MVCLRGVYVDSESFFLPSERAEGEKQAFAWRERPVVSP